MIEVKEKEMALDEKLHIIADIYGFEPQGRQLMKEMGKCIAAINQDWRSEHRYIREKRQQAREELMDELADVKVCMEQIIYLLGCESEIEAKMEHKVNRQIGRMLAAGLLKKEDYIFSNKWRQR